MDTITQIPGGVCAPVGFTAGGIHCGIAKNPEKKDLALIYSSVRCPAAAVYTKNKVKASPLLVTKEHLDDQMAQAIIANSGNANCCNADGAVVARETCRFVAEKLSISPKDVVVASTGVIGQPLPITPIEQNASRLVNSLSARGGKDAEAAIMTTDTTEKEIAVLFHVGDTLCKMGGMAKGSGMIHPNMGTMLSFLTTDVAISPELLQKALETVVKDTFNMVSVDGDTSTNDMAVILANGMSHNSRIESEGEAYEAFVVALMYVCIYLARMIAGDGEGATKLLECSVSGAPDEETARVLAKSVITSSLVKAAMFGADANCGRVLCALGYADTDTEFDTGKVDVKLASNGGEILVCENGLGLTFNEPVAKDILLADEIEILIDLHQGEGSAVAWGCDLTYDYVKINGDYRS
jgi:glutamate N-acetyltransferase/amino-acid N-acetyltransferase